MTTTHTIQITAHAIERFRERVRPGLTFEAAETELARISLAGEVTERAPAWHLRTCAQVAPLYLVVADVLMPLIPHRSEPDCLWPLRALRTARCPPTLVATELHADAERRVHARGRRRSDKCGRPGSLARAG